MSRPVLFTGDIFRQQRRGGVSRYVVEVAMRLRRPVHVTGGFFRSDEAARLGARVGRSLHLPPVPGAARVAAPVHHLIDVLACHRRPCAILHPSYYRDPRSLPAKRPMVVTVFDTTHERFPADARLGPERWKRALCARADRVICISEATRRDAEEMLGVSVGRLRVAPLASRDWSPVRPRLIPGVPTPFLLWVGPRYAYKNFEGALAAWARCREARGTRLLCLGGGPLSGEERALATRLGVADRLLQREAGDPGLRWAYESGLGLLYPSWWEGFGLPVIEALALGCPVLTSDRASLPEVGGDAAFYANPADCDALAAGLGRLLTEGRSPARMAAARVQAGRFSWDRCAALHEAVYGELE